MLGTLIKIVSLFVLSLCPTFATLAQQRLVSYYCSGERCDPAGAVPLVQYEVFGTFQGTDRSGPHEWVSSCSGYNSGSAMDLFLGQKTVPIETLENSEARYGKKIDNVLLPFEGGIRELVIGDPSRTRYRVEVSLNASWKPCDRPTGPHRYFRVSLACWTNNKVTEVQQAGRENEFQGRTAAVDTSSPDQSNIYHNQIFDVDFANCDTGLTAQLFFYGMKNIKMDLVEVEIYQL